MKIIANSVFLEYIQRMLSKIITPTKASNDYVLVEINNKSNDSSIFLDGLDRAYLISLFQRYLTTNRPKFVEYSPYKNYSYDIELVAFSLTDSKVSLLLYQLSVGGYEQYLRSVLTSYKRYFSRRHNQGAVAFRKPRVTPLSNNEAVIASKTIHRQANDWRDTRYSSLGFYINERRGDWVKPVRITSAFNNSPSRYLDYINSGN